MKTLSTNRKIVEAEHKKHRIKRGKRGFLHYENFRILEKSARLLCKMCGVWQIGVRNAYKIKLNEFEIPLKKLPESFDGFKILLLTDLHLSSLENIAMKMAQMSSGLEYDLCILGGDYCNGKGEDIEKVTEELPQLIRQLKTQSDVIAVLGNHDISEVGDFLEEIGVNVLLNDNHRLERGQDSIYIVGLDDCHYYKADDFEQAEEEIETNAFKIIVCHSPENYAAAAKRDYDLYFAGHTHGGQICLPGSVPVVTNATVPRHIISGLWKHQNLTGYTSTGAGSAQTPMRFFCQPEICLITLRKDKS